MKTTFASLFVLSLTLSTTTAQSQMLPPAPGSHCPVSATEAAEIPSYGPGDRLVATYYFYWYKWDNACVGDVCNPIYTKSHIEFATGVHGAGAPVDALTNHPLDLEKTNLEDPSWHKAQLEKIASASIDMVLPVFWGVPGRYGDEGHFAARWSAEGLRALSSALEELEKEKRLYPRVGMFYDTSTLTFESPYQYTQGNRDLDLTTPGGKNHFYATIRDFFSLVPPRFWAMWEGRPLVWLYSSEFAGGYDETLLAEVKKRFAKEFGGLEPWFVANVDWSNEVRSDWVYRWGGAIQPTYLAVNAIGPGFDNSGALGKRRGSNVLRDREEGRFYKNAWERALRTSAPLTVIETWNELHEGTEICPTAEYGEEYLEVTGRYATAFKRKDTVPGIPGPFAESASVEWTGASRVPGGLEPVESADGQFREVTAATEVVLETKSPYLYFRADDSFCFQTRQSLALEIEFFDLPQQFGGISVEYDSWDREGTLHGIYLRSESVSFSETFQWKTARFDLPEARLANNQNEAADFRIAAPVGSRVKTVRLIRM